MGKRKLTLSVSRDLLEEAKLYAREVGRSLSDIVEEYFEYLASSRWVDALAEELELGELEPAMESEIPASRPTGLDAARVVRELRKGRVEAILRDLE
jgi:hypothetical protein